MDVNAVITNSNFIITTTCMRCAMSPIAAWTPESMRWTCSRRVPIACWFSWAVSCAQNSIRIQKKENEYAYRNILRMRNRIHVYEYKHEYEHEYRDTIRIQKQKHEYEIRNINPKHKSETLVQYIYFQCIPSVGYIYSVFIQILFLSFISVGQLHD